MKEFLLLLTILIGSNCVAISQTPKTDTLCFSVEVVKQRDIEATQGRYLKKLVDTLNEEVRILDEKIFKLEESIIALKASSESDAQIIKNLEDNVADLKKEKKLSEDLIKSLTKKLKWANVKTVVVGILGLGLTIAALFK